MTERSVCTLRPALPLAPRLACPRPLGCPALARLGSVPPALCGGRTGVSLAWVTVRAGKARAWKDAGDVPAGPSAPTAVERVSNPTAYRL